MSTLGMSGSRPICCCGLPLGVYHTCVGGTTSSISASFTLMRAMALSMAAVPF